MAESIAGPAARVTAAGTDVASRRSRSQVGVRAFLDRFTTQRLPMLGVIIIVLLTVVSAIGPLLLTTSPITQDIDAVLDPPSLAHPFGTDELGRDVFARSVY